MPRLDVPTSTHGEWAGADNPATGNPVTGVVLRTAADRGARVATVALPARQGRAADWPDWVSAPVREAVASTGVVRPWVHQVRAASLVHDGADVVVATGTGSGKSLAYQLPLLEALSRNPSATALYVAPTKALAHDQMRVVREMGMATATSALVLDGDTPRSLRDWGRSHARLVLTNPDMLHASILPQHHRWSRLLGNLQLVIIDECHHYRGVFGSHVALVVRRLRRLAEQRNATPSFVLASATVANPGRTAAELTGRMPQVVDGDTSQRPPTDLVVWTPQPGTSPRSDTTWLLARLVEAHARTIAFVRSRSGAESVAREAGALVAEGTGQPVAPYRAGLLPEQRRAVESALLTGRLMGVASTNALELGVDVAGLDAVVMEGFPGTLSSMRQQMGRAGRGEKPAAAVLVAREDPLDRFLAAEPDLLLSRPVERVCVNRANPHVLKPHLLDAVAERAWHDDDHGRLAAPAKETAALVSLAEERLVRRRPTGWFRTASRTGRVGLRGADRDTVSIVCVASGQVLGEVERHAAARTVHEGAVYLHGGQTTTVATLDLDDGVALVHLRDPGWTTHPRTHSQITIDAAERTVETPAGTMSLGGVRVTSQVVGYLRRRAADRSVMDERGLDLPPQTLVTRAIWWTIPDEEVGRWDVAAKDLPGALHAAEHSAIGVLPLLASCDRRDIGGLSTAGHPETGAATIFVYDGVAGGAGIADTGYETAARWLRMTRNTVAACRCSTGCPGCIQSPQCGNGNSPLSKPGAIRVLTGLSAALEDVR